MDQYSSNTSTIPSSSSPSPHLPLFLESLPFLSPSSLLAFDPSHPLLAPPPPPPPPSPAPTRTSKKRSRASRRAPTTVLTTDTSNFRAMVQEFTGIPSPPFSSSSSSSSSSLLSLSTRSHHHFSPPFLIRPFSHKHQTTTTPNSLPIPHLSSTSNTFLQSLINTQPVFAAKPPHLSPQTFSMAGREELQQPHQGATLLDSWICSSDYK